MKIIEGFRNLISSAPKQDTLKELRGFKNPFIWDRIEPFSNKNPLPQEQTLNTDNISSNIIAEKLTNELQVSGPGLMEHGMENQRGGNPKISTSDPNAVFNDPRAKQTIDQKTAIVKRKYDNSIFDINQNLQEEASPVATKPMGFFRSLFSRKSWFL